MAPSSSNKAEGLSVASKNFPTLIQVQSFSSLSTKNRAGFFNLRSVLLTFFTMSSTSEKSGGKGGTEQGLTQSPSNSVHDGEAVSVGDSTTRDFYTGAVNEQYRLKSEIVAHHLGEIGMGKFQWILFVVNGFGWIVDNFWSQGITAIRPPIGNEFTDIARLSFSSVAYYVGLIVGASFWGTTADLIGRKPAFNATILYGGVFACAVAGTQNFTAFCALWSIIGTAAGGNVPVDSVVFLEFVPQSHQWMLVTLSAWWNLGQVIVSLLAWVFWHILRAPRPRPLAGCKTTWAGRDAEAVEAVNYIARYNGRPETLTLDMLQEVDRRCNGVSETDATMPVDPDVVPTTSKLSYMEILKESFQDYNADNYKKLFAGRKMAQHTSVTFLIWLTVGVAYPLYFAFIPSYLETKATYSTNTSLDHTYMVYCIVSSAGVVGPIAAGFLVETRFGRRWMMAASAVLTGAFLFAYTSVGTEAADIGFQCATAILGNFEYAVMYAFTPESFPGPVRGTGTGIASTLLRIGGLVASFVSTYAGYTVVPIYASAALWVLVGAFCFGLPYETHGRASL
ncbi:hexose transporter [Colletotrichum truncatum]|uniref:Hexose transporter n=1 Tax=Colletotrichum truncatum TaxID=5467 RepID=A0ACC3ZH18_COLTU